MLKTSLGPLAISETGFVSAPPLLLAQRFRGTIDDWDADLVAQLSRSQRVIRFDSLGVGASEGITPDSVAEMTMVIPALLDALGLQRVDLLGWSLGGYVSQMVALSFPERVRRLVIAGSGPGGPEGPPPHSRVAEIAAQSEPAAEDLSFLFFTETETGRAAARRHLANIGYGSRPPVADATAAAQRSAIKAWWRGPDNARPRLAKMSMPVLVANGVHDVMVPAEHSVAIAMGAPDARLVLYPDAGHGFLFQYAEDFAGQVRRFLEA